jgi:BirA family biotin operon repressor/biotin-[acetyl-CoA-carboxylase] ligase
VPYAHTFVKALSVFFVVILPRRPFSLMKERLTAVEGYGNTEVGQGGNIVHIGGNEKTYALEVVDSTNEYAKVLAKAGAVSGTVVRTRRQTQGKGTRNRSWESPEGNVYWSCIIQGKDLGNASFTELVYVNALALYKAIVQCTGEDVQTAIKWPNDILLAEKKISGSLLECGSFDRWGKPRWVVIGNGINVAVSPAADPSMLYPPTSLREQGYAVHQEAVIASLEAHLQREIAAWLRYGFAPLREAYLDRAFKLHEEIVLGLSADKGAYSTGRYEGIDETGCLILRGADDSLQTFHSGDVFLKENHYDQPRAQGPGIALPL